MSKNFSRIGNLAFYDNWSPNYVYFNTLFYANTLYEYDNNYWDYAEASMIAKRAENDAQAHSNIISFSEKESNNYMLTQFNKISQFLNTAIIYEQKNEAEYFNQAQVKLKSSFTDEELNSISELKKILKLLNSNQDFDYLEFIKCINVLLQGGKNAKLIAQHEVSRLEEINKILLELANSREKQVHGLYKYNKKSGTSEEFYAIEKAQKRLRKKIEDEYIQTKQLTRKENNKYVLFGGKQFATRVQKTAANVLADWAGTIIKDIADNPSVLQSVVQQISENYPLNDGDFKHLSNKIRSVIILGIIEYGLSNLNTVLNKELDTSIIKEIEDTLSSADGKKVFDTVDKRDITGLTDTFGLRSSEAELYKDSESIADLQDKKATELFVKVRDLVNKEKTLKLEDRSYLIQTLGNAHSKNKNVTVLQEIEDMLNLIDSITKLQNDIDKLRKKWQKNLDKNIEKIMYLDKDKNIPITITIHNGEVELDMKDLTSKLKTIDGYSYLNFKQLNPSNLKNLIATLRRRASEQLKESLIFSTKEAIQNNLFSLSESDLIQVMGHELERLTINVNGPTLAELIPGIQFSSNKKGTVMKIDWNGKIQGKNDMMVIEMRYNTILLKLKQNLIKPLEPKLRNHFTKLELKLRQEQENFIALYQQKMDEQVKDLTKSNDLQKYSKLESTNILNMKNLRDQDEELAKAQEKVRRAQRKITQELERYAKSRNDKSDVQELRDQLLNTLRESFQISMTVKSYNTYMNDIGFGGGSLGGNLDDQLNRIYDIFSSSGLSIPTEDQQWLRSAIINCFPKSVVNEKNKNLIEQYLGSLMAFALFDEGGAEEQIISDYYKNYFTQIRSGKSSRGNNSTSSKTSASILHLYVVDGLYVPGSYVLSLIKKSIDNDILPNIQSIPKAMHRGAGITIINKASEAMIPNRPIATTKNPNTASWEETGSKVAESTHIKILFLAGLLDIANKINEGLSNIPIPS